MVRILIVDDEPSAASILKLLIEKHTAGHKEIRSCSSAEEALPVISIYKPTLLMLDIEMPHMNGFDLLNSIGQWDFDVIFTTAYDRYAIKAIRFSALDYLLKPIDITELQHAVHRHISRTRIRPNAQQKLLDNLMNNLKQENMAHFKLALSTAEGLFFIAPADIIRCEGDNNYTHFYFASGKYLIVSKTLKEYEEILSDHGLIRIHKSHIVNISMITRVDKNGNVWLKDGTSVAISRRRRDEVLKVISGRTWKT